jgi:hypothetical protein
MQQPDRESSSAAGAAGDGAAENTHAPWCDARTDDMLLAQELAKWEQGQGRTAGSPLDSLALDDPALMAALRKRIQERRHVETSRRSPEIPVPAGDVPSGGECDPAAVSATVALGAGDNQAEVLPPAATCHAPHLLGRYRVTKLIGQGGFGQVFLAHAADLDRDVAVKVPLFSNAALYLDVESYLNEARILARLSHPNIVPVYDVGRLADGRWYVVSTDSRLPRSFAA